MGNSGITADRLRISNIAELSLDYGVIAVASLLTAERNLWPWGSAGRWGSSGI